MRKAGGFEMCDGLLTLVERGGDSVRREPYGPERIGLWTGDALHRLRNHIAACDVDDPAPTVTPPAS